MKLICRTGGVSTLAHPWALKNPVSIIKSLKIAGLHGMEVYRTDGKLAGKILFIILSFFLSLDETVADILLAYLQYLVT